MGTPQADPLGIASVIVGLLSWMLGCCIGSLFTIGAIVVSPLSLIGLVLGIMAARRIRAEPQTYSGMPFAVAGITINAVQLLSMLLMVVLLFLVLAGVLAIPILDSLINSGGF